MLARTVGNRTSREPGAAYPRALAKIDAAELRSLGERYIRQTRIQRKTGRPFFIVTCCGSLISTFLRSLTQ